MYKSAFIPLVFLIAVSGLAQAQSTSSLEQIGGLCKSAVISERSEGRAGGLLDFIGTDVLKEIAWQYYYNDIVEILNRDPTANLQNADASRRTVIYGMARLACERAVDEWYNAYTGAGQ